jgi:DNA excision repair protein ERCC-4
MLASQPIHPADSRIRVIVDDREVNCGTVEVLKETEGVDVTVRHLTLGDYEVDGRLLFERKTLLDLAVSIKDGRLFRQACRLVSNPLRSAIILEGTAGELAGSGMRREAMQGALITLSLVMGIPLLRSKEPRETARLMLYAARQVQSIARGALPRKVKRPLGKRRTQLQLLQGLPGVGPERARCLLETFGSVEAVFMASADELVKVFGIGESTAKSIRWAVSDGKRYYVSGGDDPVL